MKTKTVSSNVDAEVDANPSKLHGEIETLQLDQIEVKSYVGGLVKGFERKAA